jgi:uncharacterized membrane protein YozB (DUF420 family)
MNRVVQFFEKYPITEHQIFKGFEAALIVFFATILYVFNVYLRYDIMKYHPILKKYYVPIALLTHMFLVFIAVVIMIYIFQYAFDVHL